MAQAATSGESQTANLAMSLVCAFFHLFTAGRGFPRNFSLIFCFPLSVSRIRLNWLMFRVDLRYSKKGNKTCATWFATLLQIELNSDVGRFTSHVRPCVAAN